MPARGAPAPFGPERVEHLIRVGERLAREHASHRARHADPRGVRPTELVWALTREAAEAFKRVPGPGPRGYASDCWPVGVQVTSWERFGTLRLQISDGVDVAPERARLPLDRGSTDRADAMRWLWSHHALPRFGTRVEILRALWLYAGGVPASKVAAAMGVAKTTLWRRRDEACADVWTAMGEIRRANAA